MNLEQTFASALALHQAGNLAAAEALYRQILDGESRHGGALHHLGLIAYQCGAPQQARELIRQALVLSPGDAAVHDNFGTVCRAAGFLDEAIAAHRQAIALAPTMAVAHFNLGNAFHAVNRLAEAEAAYREALSCRPDNPDAVANLAVVLRKLDRPEEAVTSCREALARHPQHAELHHALGRALSALDRHSEALECARVFAALRPHLPEAHNDLGCALRECGHLSDAVAACQRAIQLRPGYAEAHNNLGVALTQLGRIDEAIAAIHESLALEPEKATTFTNLGNALLAAGEVDRAIEAQRGAIRLDPSYPDGWVNLGNALHHRGALAEAMDCYREALRLKPSFAKAYCNLGNVLKDRAMIPEAIAAYREACRIEPDFTLAESNILYSLNFAGDVDPAVTAQEHFAWGRRQVERYERLSSVHETVRDPQRRLRIGYVSPDFREHSVARFLLGVFAQHDPRVVEVFAYSDAVREDAVTEQLRAGAHHWRKVVGLPDEELAARIRADRIDILVDLAGHTASGRPLVFARRPAPVQVAWLGYPNTTGLSTIDYRLTDERADPPGTSEHLHRERLWRLPRGAWCYTAPADAPPPGDCAAQRPITFGSFNMLPKVSALTVELWSRVLRAVPGSRLVLKNQSLADHRTRESLLARFAAAGLEPDRIDLLEFTATTREHLASYHRVDLALDTFPYHGTTTTCEALWMGVPVVSLAGIVHASRVGVSLLESVGLSDLVAKDHDCFVRIATSLAADREKLRLLKAGLRDRFAASPLADARTFTRDLEAAFRELWTRWCERAAP